MFVAYMSNAKGPEVPGGLENVPTPQLTTWRLIVKFEIWSATDRSEYVPTPSSLRSFGPAYPAITHSPTSAIEIDKVRFMFSPECGSDHVPVAWACGLVFVPATS